MSVGGSEAVYDTEEPPWSRLTTVEIFLFTSLIGFDALESSETENHLGIREIFGRRAVFLAVPFMVEMVSNPHLL